MLSQAWNKPIPDWSRIIPRHRVPGRITVAGLRIQNPSSINKYEGARCRQLEYEGYTSVKNRRGSTNKAIISVAASMLTSIYFMLQRREPYKDLGAGYRDRRDKTRTPQRLIRRVQALGFKVQVVSASA